MAIDAFISYSHSDESFVVHFDAFLREAGISTWFDRRSLKPGQKWEAAIEDVIPASRVFITCLSAAGLDRRGYFHVEQQLAARAALRVPGDQIYVIPLLLGDCSVPREFRQYQAVNLADPGASEALLESLTQALERSVTVDPLKHEQLRDALVSHLGVESAPNVEYEKRFANTSELSFQDSMGYIERIANSRDPRRLEVLLRMRAVPDISYAEQKALDMSITNVKEGRPTTKLQEAAVAGEKAAIAQVMVPLNPLVTLQIQGNKYVRFVARKGTEPYATANAKLLELIEEGYLNQL